MNKWLYRAVGALGVASGALLLSNGVAHAQAANDAKPDLDPQAMRGLVAEFFTPMGQHREEFVGGQVGSGSPLGGLTDSLTGSGSDGSALGRGDGDSGLLSALTGSQGPLGGLTDGLTGRITDSIAGPDGDNPLAGLTGLASGLAGLGADGGPLGGLTKTAIGGKLGRLTDGLTADNGLTGIAGTLTGKDDNDPAAQLTGEDEGLSTFATDPAGMDTDSDGALASLTGGLSKLTGGEEGGLSGLTGGLSKLTGGEDGGLTGGLNKLTGGGDGALTGLAGGLSKLTGGGDGALTGLAGGLSKLTGGLNNLNSLSDLTDLAGSADLADLADPADLADTASGAEQRNPLDNPDSVGTADLTSADIVSRSSDDTELDAGLDAGLDADSQRLVQIHETTMPMVRALIADALAKHMGMAMSAFGEQRTEESLREEDLPLLGNMPGLWSLIGPDGPLKDVFALSDAAKTVPVVGDVLNGKLDPDSVTKLPFVHQLLDRDLLSKRGTASQTDEAGSGGSGLSDAWPSGSVPSSARPSGAVSPNGFKPSGAMPSGAPAAQPASAGMPRLLPAGPAQAVAPVPRSVGAQAAPATSRSSTHVGRHRATERPEVADPELEAAAVPGSMPLVGSLAGDVGTLPLSTLVRNAPLVNDVPFLGDLGDQLEELRTLPLFGGLTGLVPVESDTAA